MGQRSKAIRKQQRQGKARQRANLHCQQALVSNVQTDYKHAANQATQDDSIWHTGCSTLEQVIAEFQAVAVPFAHYNGRCPRRLQSRVPKEDQFYKPGRRPRKRIRKASNKPQVIKTPTFRECNEHLRALADMKGKVIYMT